MSLDIEVYPPVNGNQYVLLSGRLDSASYEQLDDALEPPEPEQLLGVIRQEKVDIGPTYWMALPLTGPST